MDKIIITGAGHPTNIGAAIARAFSHAGDKIVVPTHRMLDVGDDYECRKFMEMHSDANALVLSHGVPCLGSFEHQNPDDVVQVFNTNVIGTIFMAQAFVKATIDKPGRKTIVMIGSLGGHKVFTNSSAYCASKAAIEHLGRCMSHELTEKGFDIYVVEPGNVFGTDLSLRVKANMLRPEQYDLHATRGDIITTTEIAELVVKLVKEKMFWLTGEPIKLTGGAR